jgi:hypothetical protein
MGNDFNRLVPLLLLLSTDFTDFTDSLIECKRNPVDEVLDGCFLLFNML